MRTIIAAAFAATATVAATPAMAQDETVTIAVQVSDLDLNTAAGRNVLEQRIEARVRDACQVRTVLGFNLRSTDWDCVADAKADALAKLAAKSANNRELRAN